MQPFDRKTIDLQHFLQKTDLKVSTPGRIDCGGTWDIKALAIAEESLGPSTVNIAINLRTTIQLRPYKSGKILVSSSGFANEEGSVGLLPFNTPLGLVFAIASHFCVSGVQVDITSSIPPRSGLGGSGALAVAVVGAFWKALEFLGHFPFISNQQIALLAHNIEDGMHISLTGLQDQLAAACGGVNKWTWKYSHFARPYARQKLLSEELYPELQKRIVIAYTGEARHSSHVTLKYVNSFFDGKSRQKWREIKKLVDEFGDALHNRDWLKAAVALKQEAFIRDTIIPEGLSRLTTELRESANENDCGAAFTGGNRGGCIWAIGDEDSISEVRKHWQAITKRFKKSYVLTSEISAKGLIIEHGPREGMQH
jgi:D-glycero-alpha-D-manno-heptose-7-phosphate kinase